MLILSSWPKNPIFILATVNMIVIIPLQCTYLEGKKIKSELACCKGMYIMFFAIYDHKELIFRCEILPESYRNLRKQQNVT